MGQQGVEQLFVEPFLQCQRQRLGGEHLVLVFFKLIDDVAFVVLEGLAADVVSRHQMAVGATDFDVEAMYPVVAHLEGVDAGQRLLALLDAGQAGGGAVGQIPQLVQLLIEAVTDDATIADQHGWHLHHGALQQAQQFGEGAGALCQLLHRLVLVICQQALQLGQLGKRLPQPGEVARAGRTQGETSQHPLHIAHLTQQVAQLIVEVLLDKRVDGALATFQDHPIADRLVDPALEQTAAHGGGGAIEHLGQGIFIPARQILGQLQIAAGGGIHDDSVIRLLEAHAADVGQGGALGVFDVLHQATGGAQGCLALVDPEAYQILGAELLAQEGAGGAELELPLGATTQTTATLDVL